MSKAIITRILLAIVGLLIALLGIVSIAVAIAAMFIPNPSGAEDPALRMLMPIFSFLCAEVLLAFGLASSLLALRCMLGPREWIIKTTNYFWRKTMTFALILPFIACAIAIIASIVKHIVS